MRGTGDASSDREGDRARRRFVELLDGMPAPVQFWWRDDDAETATPALDRLLELAGRYDLPLALAVVPKRATPALGEAVRRAPQVVVLQHGWSHRNHAADGNRKAELGPDRPLAAVLDDLRNGFERLSSLFEERFLPVLVPPWNRIADAVREARREIGLTGLSTFGPVPAGDPHWVNVHLDIFAWGPLRRPVTRAEAYSRLCAELELRRGGDPGPVGIMTHHLVHEAASRHFLDELFILAARHPAVAWPPPGGLFAFPAPAIARRDSA